ncbi:branched-chain amino acid transport system substrate-binding protein [Hoeflea marina]|uniref:Branched-chain amino acid transport system substrate-binding protein n=1 Tax=Hoeflea marina TaxID=274592 RepID=A0A317PFM1_9HYPH|nr:ABC transporter substrate-binding protein [Hoeflea marina]PWV98824.1 branched-chain amino acid transport system substrate-binding protein [Hoeflea marina]
MTLTGTLRALFAGTMMVAASGWAMAADGELVLGALLPLTGPAAPIGIEEQQGVQFAIDQVNAKGGLNGVPVRIVFDDSQGKPDQAVLAFNRMADLQDVPAMITAFSSISLAIAPLATRRELLVVNPAAQTDKLENASPYLLNTIPLVKDEAQVLAKYATANIGKNAAIVYENAAAGIDGRDDFKKYFEAAGGKILAEEPVEFGQTNYRSSLLKVASVKPDFVYIAITQSHETMADQVGQVPGFPVAIGNTFSRPFFGYASTEGWYQTAIQSGYPDDATLEAFKTQFDAEDMGFFAREYFNATNIIIEAARLVTKDGASLTGTTLRDAIFKIKDFNSPIADIRFDTNTASRPVEIQQYKGKERKVITTSTASSAQ